MSDALYIGATGLQAQQLNLDTIANNLVNISTPGFKKARVSFTDLVVAGLPGVDLTQGTAFGAADGMQGTLLRAGAGVGVAHLGKSFEVGSLVQTGSPLDVAIDGDGFLAVAMPEGGEGYFRGGALKVNPDGQLATQSGHILKPGIMVPPDAKSLTITPNGAVWATVAGQARPYQLGTLQLVRFQDPTSLTALGGNLYRASPGSGEALAGIPGLDGNGSLQQGMLEGSNVKMVDEMVALMMAQRSYQASVKVVQASDEVLGLINNLRK